MERPYFLQKKYKYHVLAERGDDGHQLKNTLIFLGHYPTRLPLARAEGPTTSPDGWPTAGWRPPVAGRQPAARYGPALRLQCLAGTFGPPAVPLLHPSPPFQL